MKATVSTEVLRRAIDLCAVVAVTSEQDDDSQRIKSCLIFTVRSGVIEVASFDRRHLTVVPLEADIEDAPPNPLVFAVELFRFKKAVDYAKSDKTVIRYTLEDAEEGHVHVKYTPRSTAIPYPVFKAGSYAEYGGILERAKDTHEWEVSVFADGLQFIKQFVIEGEKSIEAHRIMEVMEDVEQRWMMQGFNGKCVGFCYPPNAGGDLKLRREDVNKLGTFLSRSGSESMVRLREAKDFYVFTLEDGASFAAKQTALRGKRFTSDPLMEDQSAAEPIHLRVERTALQATLSVVVSGMSTKSGRVRFKMGKDDSTLTITAQTADGKRQFDYTADVEAVEHEPFEHFTECRSLLEILSSLADEIQLFIRPGAYMRLQDKKKDTVRVVLVPGMAKQTF